MRHLFISLIFLVSCQQEGQQEKRIKLKEEKQDKRIKLKEEKQDKNVIHFLTEEYPPFSTMINGKITGYSVEILHKIEDQLNIPKEKRSLRLVPWSRGYFQTQKDDKINSLFSMSRSPEREDLFKWFGPIKKLYYALYSIKNHKVKDLKKLLIQNPNVKVGVIINDVGQHTLKSKNYSGNNLTSVTSIEQLYKMLVKNRIDYFFYGTDPIEGSSKKYAPFLNGKTLYEAYRFETGALWYGVNKSVSDEVIDKYQAALDKVKTNGPFMESLKKQFFPK